VVLAVRGLSFAGMMDRALAILYPTSVLASFMVALVLLLADHWFWLLFVWRFVTAIYPCTKAGLGGP